MFISAWGWMFCMASMVGLMLGFFVFRVPALLFTSAMLIVAVAALSALSGASVASSVIAMWCGLLALQLFYLAGLFLGDWYAQRPD